MLDTTKPQNNDYKIVRFTNISNFDFTSEMGAMYGGVPYFVPAGKSMLMPLSVGDHIATHLARQIIIQKAPIRDETQIDGKGSDRKLWEPTHITDLKNQILSEVYEEERTAPVTHEEFLKRKVEDLNKTFSPEVIAAAAAQANLPAMPASVPGVATAPTPSPVAILDPVTPPVIAEDPIEYKDKAEVIEALKKADIKFDARKSKSDLEALLLEKTGPKTA